MLNKKIITLLLIVLTVFACRRNIDDDITTVDPIVFPSENITASLIGEVTDENGDYVEGAQVSVGTQILTTNEDGFFYFQDINMNAKGTYVKIEKDGYFLGAKMMNATAGEVAYTKVELIKKTLIQTVAASEGGEITLDNKAKITLSANSFVDESGNAYTGNVNVYGAWMNPTTTETALRMPGDLRAVDSEGDFKQLATYGMVVVELEDESGNKLQIAEGSAAEVKMEVPSSILANAPATIPLWHFDEENGYWIEEGEAQLVGNEYVGEVKHFSFWNCDDPFFVVNLSGSVVTEGGVPVPYLFIEISIVGSGATSSGITNSEGFFSGGVPLNQLLIMTIEHCGIVYEQQIGPFTEDVVLEPVVVTSYSDYTYTIQAKLVDCDNEPIEGGLMKIKIAGSNYYVLSGVDGEVDLAFIDCGSNVLEGTYIAFDLEGEKQTQEENFTINADHYAGIGTISICDELAEFIRYTLNGTEFLIVDPTVSIFGEVISLGGNYFFAENDRALIVLAFPSNVAGSYGLDSLSVSGVLPTGESYSGYCDTAGGVACIEGTHPGATGATGEEFIGGFSGVIDDTLNVDGTFKVIFD